METAGVEPASPSVQATGALRELVPGIRSSRARRREADCLMLHRLCSLLEASSSRVDDGVRTGGVEPPQP